MHDFIAQAKELFVILLHTKKTTIMAAFCLTSEVKALLGVCVVMEGKFV